VDLIPAYEFNDSFLDPKIFTLPLSVKNRLGFEELKDEILRRVYEGNSSISAKPLLSNIRQINALEKCINALEKAQEAVYADVPFDLVSIDIRSSLEEISLITGHNVQEDLLNNIFSRFCIGK
jgi:tRNA modification GTPase